MPLMSRAITAQAPAAASCTMGSEEQISSREQMRSAFAGEMCVTR